MAVLGMIDRAVPTFQPLHVVEDSRPGSGHMQACYPAPHSGFFEAAVRPGETVAIGQPLGTIRDVLGQQTSVVPALQPGIVLVLRTFSRVAQGESLAVILETERNADAQQ
jgi:predicted deacylase